MKKEDIANYWNDEPDYPKEKTYEDGVKDTAIKASEYLNFVLKTAYVMNIIDEVAYTFIKGNFENF